MSNQLRRGNPDARFSTEGIFENVSLGISLGTHPDNGPVFQFNEDRFRHTVILGRTGSGKSNHVQRMEREDIMSGAGCFILAAHEEDALYPLSCVPEHRLGDVVFIDASNPEYLPRMNPLDVDLADQAAVDKAVSDVRDLLTLDMPFDWAGPRFEQYLRGGLGLIMEPGYPHRREIADIHRLFTDPDHVKEALKHCNRKNVHDFWTKIFPGAMKSTEGGDVVGWFLSKISRIADDRRLRHVFGAGKSTVDVRDVVDNGKILIAYVPESKIGSAAAKTIGRWLIMQLRDAIMNRSSRLSGWRGLDYGLFEKGRAHGACLDPFFVYVDEFAKFASPDFELLLAEARKQCVGFVLATQTLSQTRTLNAHKYQLGTLEEAILGNVGSMICYPVGSKDAEALSRQFDIEPEKLRRIERYKPLARLCMGNQIARPGTLAVDRRPEPENPSAARRVAKSMVISGAWVMVEGASAKGEFLKAVSGDARADATHAISAQSSSEVGGTEEACGNGLRGPSPDVGGPERLLQRTVADYAPCLPESWRRHLEEAAGRGLADASESYDEDDGESYLDYAELLMAAHSALLIADYVEEESSGGYSACDFAHRLRQAARCGIRYAKENGTWEGFEGVLGTLPAGVMEAWRWVRDPEALEEESHYAAL